MSNTDDADLMLNIGPADPQPGFDDEGSEAHWTGVKKWLAGELKELTQLWQVGVGRRREAHAGGIYRWDAPGITPEALGIKGAIQAPTLAQILAVNSGEGPPIMPAQISSIREEWHIAQGVEFYVDFEFCSDLNDDFSKLPEKGGQALIFMIGCGHLEHGQWQFSSLVVDRLTEEEELRIIQEWITHMGGVRDRLSALDTEPRIFHWSAAEPIALETAYNSARTRHQESVDWPELDWFDFLTKVMQKEPVVVKGALGFGLKAVANAMNANNMIETNWADSPVDGLGAMVGAWRCDEAAQKEGLLMIELPLMREIAQYNEVDCKVMMEIIHYLRGNH